VIAVAAVISDAFTGAFRQWIFPRRKPQLPRGSHPASLSVFGNRGALARFAHLMCSVEHARPNRCLAATIVGAPCSEGNSVVSTITPLGITRIPVLQSNDAERALCVNPEVVARGKCRVARHVSCGVNAR
jgi:hypothetical protein